jgi:hypothetical protein
MIPSVDFVGMADADLIDEAAKLQSLHAAIGKKLEEAKTIIRSRGQSQINGHTFMAKIGDPVEAWSLDKDKITKAMGEKWVAKHSKKSVRSGSVSFSAYVDLGSVKAA